MGLLIAYYSSASRNTERFVARLGLPCVRIDDYREGKYILICPTYADGYGNHPVPKPVIRFLNEHRHAMVGVVGTGNRSFGSTFALGGRMVSHKTGAPLLHKMELAGTETDIDIVRKIYAECVWQAG